MSPPYLITSETEVKETFRSSLKTSNINTIVYNIYDYRKNIDNKTSKNIYHRQTTTIKAF